MPKSRNDARLHGIETELTPKDLAIGLTHEIRRYPDQVTFLEAIARGTFRESPYVKPFFLLNQQAEDRYPGEKPEDIRARLAWSQKLRMEFQALKSIVNHVNDEVKVQSQMNRLKIQTLAIQLRELIVQDTVAQTTAKAAAWIERREAGAPDKEERQRILKDLADIAIALGPHARLATLARDWADDAAAILKDMFMRKAAIRAVADTYFDGHAILSRDIEAALETNLEMILEAIATFNEYTKANAPHQDCGQQTPKEGIPPIIPGGPEASTLTIDVERIRGQAEYILPECLVSVWVSDAKLGAAAELLRETGEHESVVWERFRNHFGERPLVQ